MVIEVTTSGTKFVRTVMIYLRRQTSYPSIRDKPTIQSKGKKGKPIPSQAWTCPESSTLLRLPDFKAIGK
jgi:hypothetical protein